MTVTTPSPEISEEEQDVLEEPEHVPKERKTMIQRLHDKFKEMVSVS